VRPVPETVALSPGARTNSDTGSTVGSVGLDEHDKRHEADRATKERRILELLLIPLVLPR
jgi:hypothetical protein